MMANYDWTRFSKRVGIRSSVDAVYAAWATREGLETWFLRTAAFTKPDGAEHDSKDPVQPGDQYRWLWHGYGEDVVEFGKILEANGNSYLKFSFAGECAVSVHLKQEEGETLVELEQENIPLDEDSRFKIYFGCAEGWTFYLANLKSILEGGIDLRNKNEKIKKVINS